MFATKKMMEFLPNIHLIGVFIVALTAVYRGKALYPIYTYIILDGLFLGFSVAWLPYVYIWLPLWGAAMLIPKGLSERIKPWIYIALCAAHGFLFGTLYAPAQALLFGFDFKTTIAWIISGLPYDAIHGVSNLICGLMIYPLILVLRRANKSAGID